MSYTLMSLSLAPTSVFGVDRTSAEIGIMTKRRREPMDRSRGTPMDTGDLPGSPIRGDSVMGNERAAASAHKRGRAIARTRGAHPPAGQTPELRVGEIGLVSGHITGHYGTLTGRYIVAASAIRDVTYICIYRCPIRVWLAPACLCVRMHVPPYQLEKERARERNCRSRSSWIMQPYLYLVSDRDFWETVGYARIYVHTNAHATPRNRDPHTVPDAPIPPLQYAHSPSLSFYLSFFLSPFLCSPSPCPRPPDSQPSPKVAKASSAMRCGVTDAARETGRTSLS